MAIRIVIVDDHDIIRAGIKSVLASHSEYEVCAEAQNGDEALECVEEFKPDILLLDISMPKISGLDIISRVKRVSAQTKIIIISVHKLGAYVLKALRQGVSGYLNKENVAEELILALSRVSAGKVYLGEAISEYLADSVKEPNKKNAAIATLNERENDVLRLVVEGKTAKEIAEVLFISRRTVENYKNSILKKLNLHKTSDLIKYSLENKILEV
ncbi:MAG: DNA-binding response regulator [Candidatus Omnitrophica bacterium CG08_land_8_20_14_0_20_41_16]|uniref:DNA-binding response regulator n=1 Tax=Candidatus Sherwoodlollariibacterium unditelluris TaxID=1974757 RepID=A0A2G9YL21_9BACT|nr:MAG: DNA-binding response regulator [Candidatus Omnitrophica bacterium CG23_combo_of_CG06-09_8_20_14_all_41_10]PIS34169.1 MAG: DNA-binding response regulator [Candidatus Omnitrophica bacterium CG08_land_8_20_14_0_20_41_16]